jgi:membrane protease YdiL (CAAX protease family)
VCGFIIGAILALPVAAGSTNGDLTNLQFAIAGVLGEVGIFVSVMGWLSIRHRRAIPALALNLRKPVDAAIGFGLGIVIYFVAVLGIAQVIGWLLDRIAGHSIQSPDQLPTSLTGFPLVLTGFLVIVCAPVAEELLFRGMLFRSLRDRHGFWPGAIVSSVLFGLVHWQGSPWESSVLLVSTLMFVGLGLASLYEWRRNILTNMAAHAGFNVVGFFLFANGNGLVPFRHWL